jgi:hypothetical protein
MTDLSWDIGPPNAAIIPAHPTSVLAPPAAASQPQLEDRGRGGLAESTYVLIGSPQLAVGVLWTVWDLLNNALCRAGGPFLAGLAQYGVRSCDYAGYGDQNWRPPADAIRIFCMTEREAHAYDFDGFIYRQQWAAYHWADALGPFAICPYPDLGMGPFSPVEVFTGAVSHELAEVLTDAVPGTGWTYPDGYEADDTACAWRLGRVSTPDANYAVSPYWRNDARSCGGVG